MVSRSVFVRRFILSLLVAGLVALRRDNPRLQVRSAGEYAAIMNALKLPNPKMMDVAVPANLRCGRG